MHHTFALFDGTWQLQLDAQHLRMQRGEPSARQYAPPDLDRIFSSDDSRRTDAKPVIFCKPRNAVTAGVKKYNSSKPTY